jgi:hypothetical protein
LENLLGLSRFLEYSSVKIMQVVIEGKENALNCEMDHLSKDIYYLNVDKAGSEEEKGTTISEYGLLSTVANSGYQRAPRLKPMAEKHNSNKCHKHMAQGKGPRPRIAQPTNHPAITPRINPSNPFQIEISAYDLQVSEQYIETVKTLFSKVQVEPDVVLKIQSLAAISQCYQLMQQQSYNEFFEEKRQYDINQWLASCREEDKKLYLDRVATATAAYTNNSSRSQQQSQQRRS